MLFFKFLNIKKMKYIKEMKYILLVIGLGLVLGSCEKFLEETPTGSLTDETTITSIPGGVALTTGAYRSLPGWLSGAVHWGGSLPGGLEYATGKAYSQYQATELWKFETNVESGDSEYFVLPWNNWYQGVRDCNLALKMLPNVSDMTNEDISKNMGEVRTLRAFYYFCLVRHYGDVIYNTSILTDIGEASRERVSLVSIYDKIIVPDLEFAIASSLASGQSSGRVTKDVARAILADVYLTMAGYPYQEARTDTTKAWCKDGLWSMTEYPVNTSSARELLQKSKTQLDALYGDYPIGDLHDINNPAMDNKGGAIFQIQFLAGSQNNGLVNTSIPLTANTSVYGVETGTYIPSLAYHDSYNPADLRIVDRTYFYYSDNKSTKYDPNEGPAGKFPLPFIYKFYDVHAIKVSGQSGLNFNLYRYADILLMLTEVNWSLSQLGTSVSAADIEKGFNEVRVRAGLPTLLASELDLSIIMGERAYELIFENKMLFDMRRTRKALVDGSGKFNGIENFVGHQPTNFNFQFSAQHLLAPISATEIDNNRECQQNFGWSPQQVAGE